MSVPHLLDTLCPMHVALGPAGHISHAGPTIAKVCGRDLAGARFLEVFELRRPGGITGMPGLLRHAGATLHLSLRDGERTQLKGVLAPAGDGAVLNLSFGIAVQEAVARFGLTQGDFAATDLAVEMLYLIEAKSAAMAASRQLNARLQGARIAAEEQAFTDTLTGLKNRRALDHVMTRLIAAQAEFTLMHLDLDHFKAVNDIHGHAAGDHVLQRAAAIMVEETRKDDTVVRLGGDEFVLIFNGLLDAPTLDGIARRLIARIEEPIAFQGADCRISASIGVTYSSNFDTLTGEGIMADADAALYASKRRGRAQHTVHLRSPPARDAPDGARHTHRR